jgi:site-specific DNA recombinase
MLKPLPVRCAIYTRKSTEEGLTREFNSLEAQREAAEAYVLSQRQSGWTALAEHYDDGGFSGASIDRPAMRKLLADVEAGRIDCVVVYKVDRLSRSLLDFARLMEMFEERGVSFVSVTQDFNTRSSLGRLTLHILLSFAEFERQIIGERTRDKLSAARRKGKWMGGCPVLGYEVDALGGGLRVNEPEAAQVREMFGIAAKAVSLRAALAEITALGYRTKQWTSSSGRLHSAQTFSRASLARLLSNVLYTGVVSHQGQGYPGEHTAIVSEELWKAVQQRLPLQPVRRPGSVYSKTDALLARLLKCGICGEPMRLRSVHGHGRVYRYYVCRSKGEVGCAGARVAAVEIEGSLLRQLEPILGCDLSRPLLQGALERVTYEAATRRVVVVLRDGTQSEYVLAEPRCGGVQRRREPIARVPRISRLMALAIRMEKLTREGRVRTHGDLAEAGQISRSRLSQILKLTELAPAIQEQLLFLPKIISGRDRIHEYALRPIARMLDWEAQMKAFRALLAAGQSG